MTNCTLFREMLRCVCLAPVLGLAGSALLGVGCTRPPRPASPGESSSSASPPAPPVATPAAVAGGGISLFDGKTLTGWRVTDFAGHGEVKVEDGRIILGSGVMTGVTWTNDPPRIGYEIAWEAMRVDGSDFFCALTFPVNDDPCSLVIGGWGGGVVGLSSLDGQDAANNDTTKYMNFENGRWYNFRLRVTTGRIEAWIDGDPVVNVETKGRQISIRVEVEPSKPLGFATWATTGALRNITLRRL